MLCVVASATSVDGSPKLFVHDIESVDVQLTGNATLSVCAAGTVKVTTGSAGNICIVSLSPFDPPGPLQSIVSVFSPVVGKVTPKLPEVAVPPVQLFVQVVESVDPQATIKDVSIFATAGAVINIVGAAGNIDTSADPLVVPPGPVHVTVNVSKPDAP